MTSPSESSFDTAGKLGDRHWRVNACVANACDLPRTCGDGPDGAMPVTAAQIGEAVRAARDKAGLTQAGLAEAADISDETVSRIERGAYEPAVSTLIALADALGVSVEQLVGRAGRGRLIAARSPLVARLAERADALPHEGVQALLRLAQMLPEKRQAEAGGKEPSKKRRPVK